jgi:hypothetical protein
MIVYRFEPNRLRLLLPTLSAQLLWGWLVGCDSKVEVHPGSDAGRADASAPDAGVLRDAAGTSDGGVLDAGKLRCDEGAHEWFMLLEEVASEPDRCDVDTDCVLVEAGLSCAGGAEIPACPLALHRSRADSTKRMLETWARTSCEQIEPCRVSDSCPGVQQPVCKDGTCQRAL